MMYGNYGDNVLIFLSFFVTAYFFQKINFLPQITTSSIGERYYFLDGLRGICAIFVVITHSHELLGLKGFNLTEYGPNSISFLGIIGVQMFFCITGFLFIDQLIKKNYNIDWITFFSSRIKRLLPLFFFSITMSLIIIYIINFNKLNTLSLDDVKNSLGLYFLKQNEILGINSNHLLGATWTLPYEWRFYMALPLFCAFVNLIKVNPIILFSIFGVFVGKYFLIGCFSALLFNKYKIKNNLARVITLLLAISSLVILSSSKDVNGNDVFIFSFILFLGLVMSPPDFLSKKIYVYCGEISYSIYLLHMPLMFFITYLSYFLFGVTKLNNYNFIFVYSISSILICIISFFSYKYIEYPFLKK
ncbi:MAG: acyltransferase family protein [Candidatus Phlomobacter fragariae]